MSIALPPPPSSEKEFNFVWQNWLSTVARRIVTSVTSHTDLTNINGDTSNQHIALTTKTDLTNGGDSSLHYHSSDRVRSNHTGTQLLNTISDVTITATNLNILDDGGSTILHYHSSDRDRNNHTGTQLLSTISDAGTAASVSGSSVTITLAKVTTLGSNGSLTFTNGVLTGYTNPT